MVGPKGTQTPSFLGQYKRVSIFDAVVVRKDPAILSLHGFESGCQSIWGLLIVR